MVVRRLSILSALVCSLAFAPAASAAYPAPYAVQGGAGVPGAHGTFHYVALAWVGSRTRLEAVRDSTGLAARKRLIPGSFGIPTLTQSGLAGGLSHDGRTLVLQSMGLADTSRFAIVRTRDLRLLRTVTLHGTFGYDALSPDGATLYLIQHTSAEDIQHYVVRAYDLRRHLLLPGRIADKTQANWLMQGWAVSRAETANGRWDYTLYANPGGYPFIHALDTVAGVAHCVGLPWMKPDQNPVWNFTLAVQGNAVLVKRADGSVWKRVNRTNWRLTN